MAKVKAFVLIGLFIVIIFLMFSGFALLSFLNFGGLFSIVATVESQLKEEYSTIWADSKTANKIIRTTNNNPPTIFLFVILISPHHFIV